MDTDRERGEYHDTKAARVIFDMIAQGWLSSRNADPSSKIRYESLYRLHVQPTFGARQVKAIKPSEVQTWQAELGERFGPSTVATARLVLLGILDLAVADDAIRKNPAKSPVVETVKSGNGEKIGVEPGPGVRPDRCAHRAPSASAADRRDMRTARA
jgi:hypothetical protein